MNALAAASPDRDPLDGVGLGARIGRIGSIVGPVVVRRRCCRSL